jgi:uncharacterized protein DUF3558
MSHSRQRTIVATAIGIAGCLLLAGCSGGSPGQAPSSTAHPATGAATTIGTAPPTAHAGAVDPCSLVTEDEAGAALGADPGPGEMSTAHGASSCIYGESPTLVSVSLVPNGGKAAYLQARSQAPAGQLNDVAALGDGAFGVFTGSAAEIWFYQGDSMVAVGLIVGGSATPLKDPAVVLAELAAGRL